MTNKRTLNETILRCLTLLCGLIVLSFGIAFSVRANLGTTPISSVPYVISLFAPLTIGTATMLLHVAFLLVQLAVKRRRFDLKQLLGLPAAIALGVFADAAMWLTRDIAPSSYGQQWLLCVIGILLAGIGASLDVTADIVMLPSDGLVAALIKAVHVKSRLLNLKVLFDSALVVAAIALSLLFLLEIHGVREGTAAAAILVGQITRQCNRLLSPYGKRLSKT